MVRARERGSHSFLLGIGFATPAVLLLGLFIVLPIFTGAAYSTTSASGYGDKEPVGLANYQAVLQDGEFAASLVRNVVFAFLVVSLSVTLGFVLAYVLFLGVRGWRAAQGALMIPNIVPVVVTALMWQFLLEPENGLVNRTLRAVGLDALAGPWLSGPSTALVTVSLVQAWVTIPFAMLLIFGGMLALDREVLEAAEIDGAGHLTRMFRIVLPMTRNSVILVAFVLTVSLFRSFDLVWLLTNGGPLSSTTISTLYVYITGFVNNQYGYANAVGVVLALIVALFASVPSLRSRAARRKGTA